MLCALPSTLCVSYRGFTHPLVVVGVSDVTSFRAMRGRFLKQIGFCAWLNRNNRSDVTSVSHSCAGDVSCFMWCHFLCQFCSLLIPGVLFPCRMAKFSRIRPLPPLSRFCYESVLRHIFWSFIFLFLFGVFISPFHPLPNWLQSSFTN